LPDELEIGFVDESRGLVGVARPFVAHERRGEGLNSE
jgi:hypothetical protein